MQKLVLSAGLIATPSLALAASEHGPFVSLGNSEFIVTVGFLLFVAVLIYFKVPGIILGLLDKRATQIRADLEEARALREEARTILASYDRKQKEVQEQAARMARKSVVGSVALVALPSPAVAGVVVVSGWAMRAT